jgi:radical SAM superfamily enzyme with C-terminal helix-hairpin-helix motif
MTKVTILDGYVDEPTCLGVPPYISPYPRYIGGAIWDFDESIKISYFTIDQLRNNHNILDLLSKSDLLIVISGMTVPGRYLSGFPASPYELEKFLSNLSGPIKILAGPAAKFGFGIGGGKGTINLKDVFDLNIKGDGETVINELLKAKLNTDNVDPAECRKNSGDIKNYALMGSEIVKQHPHYPDHLITEIETYRGCPRSITGGCSFCSEPLKGFPDFRPIENIIFEIKALYDNGIRHIRLGNQPCIFSYMAKDSGKNEFPKPSPSSLRKLFRGIKNVAPNLKTLHIDNANPGVIARYPLECTEITKTIVKHHTPGDVAALGVESADPVVIKKNNLKASPEEAIEAVKLLNKIGAKRGSNGMPELLPGINFVFGLSGETKNTYRVNYEFLRDILEQNLLLRRINIRQIIPIPGTEMHKIGNKISKRNKNQIQKFKHNVRENIEKPLLEKLIPKKTILKDVYTEIHKGKLTFGRQLGSYPLLIGIPGVHPIKKFIDVRIVDHGYRSITGLPYPLDINTAPRETIMAIPGIGKKRAVRIILKRPIETRDDLEKALDDPTLINDVKNYVSL